MSLTELDQGEILQFAGRYAQPLDSNDSDGWAECFTSEGAYESELQEHLAGRENLNYVGLVGEYNVTECGCDE